MKSTTVICIMLTATSPGTAIPAVRSGARTGPVVVRPPQLKEQLRRSVLASGLGVAGLTSGDVGARISRSRLVVSGMVPSDRTICVSMESASGLYTARFSTAAPTGARSTSFDLRTRLLDRDARLGQLAIRAQASSGATCAPDAPLLRASWDAVPRLNGFILINSTQATSISVGVNGGPARDCRRLRTVLGDTVMSVRSFDMLCDLPDGVCGRIDEVAVYRRDSYDVGSPYRLRIRGRCDDA